MRNNYWLNEYDGNYLPYYCPYCQSSQFAYDRFYDEDFYTEYSDNNYRDYEPTEDYLVRYPIYGGENYRSRNEIEDTAKSVFLDISKDLTLIENMPIAKELMHYIILVIGDYINKNHEKFFGPIEKKISEIATALRKDLYWIFDILAFFGVSPETAVSFVENVVSKFLRALIPQS
ncbi:hypothetical protein [Candidatus Clostridium stratigraminis]|uniref:Uncharacterized protein n=1 Tax=Candidatus Clostridium stratigraminis TaxID=3381661 RepID=A0ABW8SY70_9CLOT